MTTSTSSSSQPGDPNISWPTERPPNQEWHPSSLTERGRARPSSDSDSDSDSSSGSSDDTTDLHPSNYPSGTKSLSGISLRAFLLGTSLGITSSMTILLATFSSPFWRVPFFIAALSLFHFLEFFVTARYNTPYATVKAFLLSSNGWAYNVAHGSALVESIISHWLWPGRSSVGRMFSFEVFGTEVSLLLVAGLFLTVMGQVVRTLAMATAAGNFNHHVQVEREDSFLVRFFGAEYVQ
ncbi:hypothetical protein PENDEC_c039G01514 [Penicillium decumbens]|uniref:Protein-S-isoprenylcysteine O-methyltransferase n=1 Tax=Penicillium decumbens TaxID=69771 RepID=A0A1V6NRZ1_PENDC|nr:hypothetical protein PENDEC_c039G01514 [Penicillium decumbens]